ncbi:MAG: AbrB family transcriptional regulator [Candidatus Micrarchaeota archaeon]|nr:AbrB family transcriptional regulator [Candidatus Micrarchaeota archaeon]
MERATVVVDRQRRIYLPKRFKEKAGSKFFIVKMGDEIRLVPIPANPIEDLAKLGSKLPAKSIRQFRKEISAEAKKVA